MAKSLQRHTNNGNKAMIYAFIAAAGTSVIFSPEEPAIVIGVAIIVGFISLMWPSWSRSIRIAEIEGTIRSLTKDHSKVLLDKRKRSVFIDEYGCEDNDIWHQEIKRFHKKVILPNIKNMPENFDAFQSTRKIVDDLIKPLYSDATFRQNEREDGLDFEIRCSQILQSNGWSTYPTRASGDQGADVIAEKGGFRLVLQCKRYSGSVGNQAVQEVYGALRHYEANAAAVVTTGRYTKSAQQLASTNSIFLLYESDLAKIDDILFNQEV